MTASSTVPPEPVGAALECLAVVTLTYGVRLAAPSLGVTRYVGSIAMVLAIVLATWHLARRGATWHSVGFARPLNLGHSAAWTIGTFLVLTLILPAILEPVSAALALPPQHLERLGDIKGSTVRFLVLLFPIGWGTAAFGEELVFRGFLNTRLAAAFGGGRAAIAAAAVGQALLFGLAHLYLGPRGVLNASAIGLVAAGIYLADGRNLWPLIISHGLLDTVNLMFLRLGMGHG